MIHAQYCTFSATVNGPTHPVSDVEKTLLIGEVKQENETHRIPKKSRGQTPKPDEKEQKKEEQKDD